MIVAAGFSENAEEGSLFLLFSVILVTSAADD
jgi:hypothetical protein